MIKSNNDNIRIEDENENKNEYINNETYTLVVILFYVNLNDLLILILS